MSQYRNGTVTVVNGSQIVTGADTLWLNEIKVGQLFKVSSVDAFYEISNVVSDTEIHLSTPWSGANLSNVSYSISRDFTPSGIPYPTKNDVSIPSLLRRSFLEVDKLISTGVAIDVNVFTVTNNTGTNKTNWDTRDVSSGGDSTDGGGVTSGYFEVFDIGSGQFVQTTVIGLTEFTTASLPNGTVLYCKQISTSVPGGSINWGDVQSKPSLIVPIGYLDPSSDPLPTPTESWSAWIISSQGQYDLGSGNEQLYAEDWLIWDGSKWIVVVGKNRIDFGELNNLPSLFYPQGDYNASNGNYPVGAKAGYWYDITDGGVLNSPTVNGVTEVFRGDALWFDSNGRWHHVPGHAYIVDSFLGRWLYRDDNFNATTKNSYRVDTINNPIQAILPADSDVEDGDEIRFRLITDNVEDNNFEIVPQGSHTIDGSSGSFIVSKSNVEISAIFTAGQNQGEGNWDLALESTASGYSPSFIVVDIDNSSSPYTVPDGKNYIIRADTSSGPITINAPNANVDGQLIQIRDKTSNFVTNNLTFVPKTGDTVLGDQNLVFNADNVSLELMFDSQNTNWII